MKDNAVQLLIILVAALAVFGPSLGHDFLINWDDPPYVTKNEAIRAISWTNIRTVFTSFYVGNYAPLHIVSYMFDYALWGERPAGFILTNILCHAMGGTLFYVILGRFSLSKWGALFAALVFLLHPVQVESVVWVAQRKNVLALLLYLLALLLYLRWSHGAKRSAMGTYAASLVVFAAALLVKSVAVILPLTLLLLDHCCPGGDRSRKTLSAKLPYLLIALAVGTLALVTQSAGYGGGGRTGFHGGSPLATLYTMLPVLLAYIRLVIWPSGLSVVYSPAIKTAIDGEVAAAAAVLLLFALAMVWLYRRNRTVFFWAAAIPLGLLPVSQIVPLVTLMNDRYLYFPMLGVAACCGYLFDRGVGTVSAGRRPLVIAVFALLPLLLGSLALNRARVWQSSFSLWQDAVGKQPGSAVAWLTMGDLYEKAGRLSEAIESEKLAVSLCRRVECRLSLRRLSELYLQANMADKASDSIAELLRLYPDAAEGHTLAGNLNYQLGNLEKAENSYLQALQLDPRMVSALSALGNVYLVTGRPDMAILKFREAIRLQKPTAELAYSMACAAAQLGDRRLALDSLDEALRLGYNSPDLIRHNPELGLLRGDPELARLLARYFPGR